MTLPRGAATRRFLGLSGEGGADPAGWGLDVEDCEPHYIGWEIARSAGGLDPGEQRALASLVAACVESMRAGSTRLPLVGSRFTQALGAVGAAEARDAVGALVRRATAGSREDPVRVVLGLPGERRPLIVDGDWLYAERMRVLEERFCARVRERLASRAPEARDARAFNRALAATSPSQLTNEQRAAVRDALGAPLALITGGPGTGKTTTVVALVRALAWLGTPALDAIAIAAPTGKAAQRLADAIAAGVSASATDFADAGLAARMPPPTTLHRLLGWSPSASRFARHENDPLAHRLVIVDEASMIDLAMMDRLLRALRPEARLVLLGDADQLPSVEAGAVFRDLCAAAPTRRLTFNLRVARDPAAQRIVEASRAVNAGALDAYFDEAVAPREDPRDVTFSGVEHLALPWSRVGDALLDRWWSRRTAADPGYASRVARTYRVVEGEIDAEDRRSLSDLFAFHARARLLCLTRAAGTGTSADAINAQLATKTLGSPGGALWRARRRGLEPGTPVLVQRNDYERGLFNGDQGVMAWVDTGEGPRPMAVFARGPSFVAFAPDSIADLAPAYAMTVHKAQGSEFDDVTLVLPDADLPLATRELVYTAITRARRSVLLVGDRALLGRAVSRSLERFSGVADRLRTAPYSQ